MTTRTLIQPDQTTAHAPLRGSIQLSILGGFELRSGDAPLSALAPEAQRLLALLALRDRPVPRAAIAGTLWPDASEMHASASLRSALSRLGVLGHEAIVITAADLALAPATVVDLHDARALAHRLLDTPPPPQTSAPLPSNRSRLTAYLTGMRTGRSSSRKSGDNSDCTRSTRWRST